MTTVIENAWILTMDDEMKVIKNGYVTIEADRILLVGEGPYTGDADKRIDAKGGILIPGFVNTHCHVSMVPFRTMGDDCPDRLRRFLFPLENEAMTRELVYHGAMYGIMEMLLSGTTTFVDMYYFEDEVARACINTGIRGYLGETIIDQPTCDSPTPAGGLDIARSMFDRYPANGLVKPIIAPHGTTTCSQKTLQAAHELAVEHDTLFTLHASEMDYEMKYFADQNLTPTSYLHMLGCVDEHLLAAHCIHMTDYDISLLRDGHAAVAHCIGSNMKAGKGIAPAAQFAKVGVPFGLGTDGPSSGNTLSMFDQMRVFAIAHKTANKDRSLFPAQEIVAAATRGGAQALGAGDQFGQIKPGMKADLTLVSLDSVSMFPVYNPYSALVYSASARDVDTVIVNGRVLVEGKKTTTFCFDEIRTNLLNRMGSFMESAAQYADII